MDNVGINTDPQVRDRIAAGLQSTIDDASRLLEDAQKNGGERLEAMRARLAEQIRRAGDELSELQHAAKHHAKRAARATDEAVHEHPYAAMGIAGAVGVLLGMLIARR